ncbi:MAG TPA: NRDE family protein [Burkholderiales bacterium]|nr:NRDE family protein [Burkholderiales bacterium]
MCLILLAWHAHPDYPLVFAGNRDEAYERPSAAADFWNDDPAIYGGRDLEKGGTWLGLTRTGRLAAVTNYRDGPARKPAPRSRGELTANFLRSDDGPEAYLKNIAPNVTQYGGFSLLVGDSERLWSCSNRGAGIEEVAPGVHGLSNHLLDTPWPKVTRGRQKVAALLEAGETELIKGLFDALADRSVAADAELPDTGVGAGRERELSPAFIAGERYGTRASTVLFVSHANEVTFIERRFGALGAPQGETTRQFALQDIRARGRVTKAAGQDV